MRVQVGDVWLFFDVEGPKLIPDGPTMCERPTLLLLHGGPGFDHSGFKPQLAELSDIVQVVYLDHRGNGRSDRGTREQWKLNQWADDVRAFCDALEIVHPIVLGQSFGGFVAMAYATRHPDHPRKLILSSTAARLRLERVLDTFERLGGATAREVARRFLERPADDTADEYIKVCFPLYTRRPRDPDILARTILNAELMFAFLSGEHHTYNLLPDLAKVRCPTLVLAGEDDPITPIESMEEIAKALQAELVRFVRFPGCGHGVFRDNSEAGLGTIRQFLLEE